MGQISRVPYRCFGGQQLRLAQIERTAQTVQHINHRGRTVAPADAQPSQPVNLREGPRHYNVVTCIHQGSSTIITLNIFGIGTVYDQKRLRRQVFGKPGQFGDINHGARRVGRVGDEHQTRPIRTALQDFVDIDHAIDLGHLNRGRPRAKSRNPIHGKPVLGIDHLIPRTGIGLTQEGNNFV